MAKVKIEGNASGTGTFTIAAPNSNTDRTLTLPDEAGTVVVTDGTTLVVDNANDRVGIGTSSPAVPLHVYHAITNGVTRFESGDADCLVQFKDSNTTLVPASVGASGNNFVVQTNNTERMRIDSSGRVTMPYQPAFTAYGGARQDPSSIEAVIFNNTSVNVGNHYSTVNSRFTAPIAGNYYFYTTFMNNSNEYCRYGIYKNGAVYGQAMFLEATAYARATNGMVIALSAGDYVDVRINTNSGNEGDVHDEYRVFTGYLVG